MIAFFKRILGLTPPPALYQRSLAARSELEAYMKERAEVDAKFEDAKARIQKLDMHVAELKLWASKLPKKLS